MSRRLVALSTLALLAALLFPLPAAAQPEAPVTIEVLSGPAEYVSGGDARIRITADGGVAGIAVTLNRVDVTDQLTATSPTTLEGVVGGLGEGRNHLAARMPGGAAGVTLFNHPVAGPMFSGPHQEPFVCETEAAGLGPALDEDCSAPTAVTFLYKATDGTFKSWPGSAPADLAQTTTSLGETVDYIVRLETGTINRAVYQTAILFDPAAATTDAPGATPGWNGRLVYSFGGGCNAGYHQGQGNGGVLSDLHLALGYGVASSSLNVLNNNCNDVLSAETALMVKERFIESYGAPLHTIGWGGSGGAIQQHLIAHNYPGILDGIIPTLSYPDATSIFPGISDCRLFVGYFAGAPAGLWDAAAQDAVVGYDSWNNCLAWDGSFTNRLDPDEGCPGVIPADWIYDAATNPDGVRCTVTDHIVNIIGVDPHTGFAYTVTDNTGVQYGLEALNAGDVTVGQFLDLNAAIGGFDVDANIVPERARAPLAGLHRMYSTGRIVTGAGLATTPILDLRPYLDPFGDIHDRARSFTMRQRLMEDNGDADNQVIQVVPFDGTFGLFFAAAAEGLLLMDQWLTTLGPGDHGADDVAAAKPAALVDACWAPDGTKIVETQTYDGPGLCNQLYPNNADPRIVAGAALANDVLSCRLRQPRASDYAVGFTAEEWSQMRAIFPSGVCDWSKRGLGEVPFRGAWQSFGS